MLRNSNKYTLIFSSAMVIIVAVLLALAATSLAPFQARNKRIEKMQNILSSVGIYSDSKEAEATFNSIITTQVVLNNKGETVTGEVAAFDIDLKKEMDKEKTGDADKEMYPMFIGKVKDKTYYIVPVRGKGLWGPIWGYLSLEEDMNTIHGASFGHKSETPGLGAEIETPAFQDQFKGKQLFDDTKKFVSVKAVKGGAAPGNLHGVDAISGATVTSNGVTEMIYRALSHYIPYFESQKNVTAGTAGADKK